MGVETSWQALGSLPGQQQAEWAAWPPA